MRAVNDRSAEAPSSERRSRRTDCLADALRFQLDACREAEGLVAIVVSDELGFCVAHSGGDGAHGELAAQLPIFAHPVRPFEDADDGELLQTPCGPMVVTTFSIGGATLHACAVGAPSTGGGPSAASGLAVLERVASGFSRLLA
jgi:hypothetical protein